MSRLWAFVLSHGHSTSWVLPGALGEMRGVFGVYLAILAAKFGVSFEVAAINVPLLHSVKCFDYSSPLSSGRQ